MLAWLLKLILTFLILFAAIVAFMAPFYAVYWYRHVRGKPDAGNFNLQLEHFFTSRQANYMVLCWAAGEATFWFVIPEFLLFLVIFMRINRKIQLVTYDIYGTLLGSLVALNLHFSHDMVSHLPFIRERMLTSAAEWYHQLGVFALIHQPFSGVPFKVFTFLAADQHFFVPLFLLMAVVVRISRYYILYVLLNSLYPVLHKYVYRHYVPLFIAAVFIFTLLLLRVLSVYS